MATGLQVLCGFIVVIGIAFFFGGLPVPVGLGTGSGIWCVVGLMLVFGGLWLNKAYAKPEQMQIKEWLNKAYAKPEQMQIKEQLEADKKLAKEQKKLDELKPIRKWEYLFN